MTATTATAGAAVTTEHPHPFPSRVPAFLDKTAARIRTLFDGASGFLLCAMLLCTPFPAYRIVRGETGSFLLGLLAAGLFTIVFLAVMRLAAAVIPPAFGMLRRLAGHRLTFPILLATGILLRLAYACLHAPAPDSDYRTLLAAALRFSAGDFSYTREPYFQAWGYQAGMVILEGGLLRLSHGGIWLPACIWILCSAGTGWLIWQAGLAAFRGRNRGGLLLGTALYVLSIPSVLYAAVLSNDHPALFLIIAACCLPLSGHGNPTRHTACAGSPKRHAAVLSFLRDAACGALLASGHLLRPLGVFVLIAIGLWLVLLPPDASAAPSGGMGAAPIPHGLPHRIRRLAVIACVFFLVLAAANRIAATAGWSDGPMANRDPLYKVTVGLNPQTRGWFSEADAKDLGRFPPGPQRRARNQALIRARLSDPASLPGLFLSKFASLWGDFDGCIGWGLGSGSSIAALVCLSVAAQLDYAALLLFACLPPFLRMRHRWRGRRLGRHATSHARFGSIRAADPLLLCRILLIGYVLVHLVIEIQTRYRYFFLPFLCLMAGEGTADFVVLARLQGLRALRRARRPVADRMEKTVE